MKKDNGGAAFPSDGYGQWAPQAGMTLRDYFAAKAMQGILANEKQMLRYGDYGLTVGRPSSQVAAEAAYVQADAMLAAREAE